MKKPTLNLFIFSLLIIFVTSCIQQTEQKSTSIHEEGVIVSKVNHDVSPPDKAWDIPYEKHQLQADQAQQIQTRTGSLIDIPAHVLVDADGNAVTGIVEISYREFHSAADIFRSGIPMRYDSAGTSHILRSAGMFEMRAAQQGKSLFIAEGKQINVEMNSTKSGAFNFYKLNEAGDNNWQFIASATAEPFELPNDSVGEEHQDAPQELAKPEKANKNAVVFDFKTNYQVYPELAKYKNVLWQDANKTAKDVLDVEKNEWIFGEVWTEANVKRAGREGAGYYYLDLQNAAKKARLLVKPVLEGQAYVEALKTYQQDKAEQERLQQAYAQRAQEAIQAEQVRQAALAATGSFYTGISTFGYYNWDLIIKKGDLEMIAADFQFENGDRPEEVYLIMRDAPVALKFPRNSWNEFTFSTHWESMVVAVLPDKRLVMIGEEMLLEKLRSKREKKFIFYKEARIDLPEQIADFFAP
jgi:hypothetical protein